MVCMLIYGKGELMNGRGVSTWYTDSDFHSSEEAAVFFQHVAKITSS